MNKSEHSIWTTTAVRATLYTPNEIKRVRVVREPALAHVVEELPDSDSTELATVPVNLADGWQAVLGKVKRWARDNGWRLRPR